MNRSVGGKVARVQQRFSWLDFKLGLRMLARYPVLTIVGTVAIAIATTSYPLVHIAG